MTAVTRTRHRFASTLAAVILLVLAAPASAQDDEEEPSRADMRRAADRWQLPEPDTANWRCRNCPFPAGWNGSYELGAGIVSDDSFEFGDYRGLEDEGVFPVLEGEALYRGEDGDYHEIRVEELGLDTRSVRAESGRQGRYGIWLEYDQLPHLVADDTRTVFTGAGSANLGLPGGWVRANTTGSMTALDSSLRGVEIEQERESLGLGVDVLQGDRWHYNVEFRNDTREGSRVQGGSFLFRSALLPAPVDYETDSLDASVAYVRDRWQLQAGFHTSMFTNENEALVWDNPFTSANGADQGRLALPPDNQFNQVSLSGSWRSRGSLAVAGRVAVGRMQQDEDFLAPTINSSLAAPNPPRNDLDGEVDTRTLNLRVSGAPADRLTATAEFSYDERDNDSPRDSYVQIATDEIVSNATTNTPYSYEKTDTKVTLDYRLSPRYTVSGSAGHEEFDRTFQEVEQTETDTLSLALQGMATERLQTRLGLVREERDGSYEPLGLTPMENPDLRKFHIARRDRDALRLAFNYFATDQVGMGFQADIADDEYVESDIGLNRARERSYSLDLTASPAEGVTAYAFVSLQQVEADLLGTDNITGTPWSADEQDDYQTIGLGLEFADLPGRFTRGALDLTYSTGDTDIRVDKSGVGVSEFPEITTRLYTLNVHADRTLGKNSVLRLGYLLEGFSEQDFQRDGIDPDTVPTVLTLGEGTPSYTVHVLQLSLRYEF